MEPTLICRNGCNSGFMSITNDFTQLKGKANAGMVEMEVTGECSTCGIEAYNSIVGPIESLTLVTSSSRWSRR